MTLQERAKFVQNFIDTHVTPVMVSKGKEYSAGVDDANANFKRTGSALGVDPLSVAFIFASKHWDSITNYVKTGGKGTLTEPIEGRLGDLINYLLILATIIDEKRNQQTATLGGQFNPLVETAQEQAKYISPAPSWRR